MKNFVMAGSAAVAAMLWCPAAHAEPYDRLEAGLHTGTFAGARFRVALGGKVRPKIRMAVTFAPMLRAHYADGRTAMRIGEGVAFGFDARGPARMSLGGRPLSSLTSGPANDFMGDRAGLSTGAAIGIGVGVAVIAGALLYVDALNDASE